MKNIKLDMTHIGDEEDFFNALFESSEINGDLQKNKKHLPLFIEKNKNKNLKLEIINLSVEQLEDFDDIITDLEDLEEHNPGFHFVYKLEQWEDLKDPD